MATGPGATGSPARQHKPQSSPTPTPQGREFDRSGGMAGGHECLPSGCHGNKPSRSEWGSGPCAGGTVGCAGERGGANDGGKAIGEEGAEFSHRLSEAAPRGRVSKADDLSLSDLQINTDVKAGQQTAPVMRSAVTSPLSSSLSGNGLPLEDGDEDGVQPSVLPANVEKALDWLGKRMHERGFEADAVQMRRVVSAVAEGSPVNVGNIMSFWQCGNVDDREGFDSDDFDGDDQADGQMHHPPLQWSCGSEAPCKLSTDLPDFQQTLYSRNSSGLDTLAQQELEDEMYRLQRMTSWATIGTTATTQTFTDGTVDTMATFDTLNSFGTDTKSVTGATGTTTLTSGGGITFDVPAGLGLTCSNPSPQTNASVGTGLVPQGGCIGSGAHGMADKQLDAAKGGGSMEFLYDDDGTPLPADLVKLQQQRSIAKRQKIPSRSRSRDNAHGHRRRRRRRRKVVKFEYPPISSLKECPRINPADRSKLFFTEQELDQIEDDRKSTKTTDDVEIVAVAIPHQNDLDAFTDQSESGDESRNRVSLRSSSAEAMDGNSSPPDEQITTTGLGNTKVISAAGVPKLPPRAPKSRSKSPAPQRWSRTLSSFSDGGGEAPPSPARTDSAPTSVTNTPERNLDDVAEKIVGIMSNDTTAAGGLRAAAAKVAAGHTHSVSQAPMNSPGAMGATNKGITKKASSMGEESDGLPGSSTKRNRHRKRGMLQGVQIYLRNRSQG